MGLDIKYLFRRALSSRKKDDHVQKLPYVVKPFHDPAAARSHADNASSRHHSSKQSAQSSLEPNDELVTAPTSPHHAASKIDDSTAAPYMPDLPAFTPLTLEEDHQHLSAADDQKLENGAGEMKHSEGEGGYPSQAKSLEGRSDRPKRKPLARHESEDLLRKRSSIDSGAVKEHFNEPLGQENDKHDFENRQQNNKEYRGVDLDGIVDLEDTEETDRTTTWAPAVTHEIVKPTEHEIVEERVYREIHNHDYYHYVLPVHETVILPPRHFVTNHDGSLTEVQGDAFPDWTTRNQQWQIAPKERHDVKEAAFVPRQTEPRILSDRTYITPEGYPRRETTILHPPELDDLSDYTGPVMPIEFTHFEQDTAETGIPVEQVENRDAVEGKGELRYRHQLNDSGSFSLTDMMNSLSIAPNGELRT